MPGDRVLVLGAGYMGLLNVIGLAHSPVSELVVTDIKEKNLELARSFGATHIINSGTDQGRGNWRNCRRTALISWWNASGFRRPLTRRPN